MHYRLRAPTIGTIATAGMAVAFAVCPAVSGAPATPLGEIVLYGIDADTHELLRYTFDTDTYTRIGVVVDQNGFEIDHPEAFTYIPSGDYKGFYAVSNQKDSTGGPQHTLARINGMDATCVMSPQPVMPDAQIRGMTTVPDATYGDHCGYRLVHGSSS